MDCHSWRTEREFLDTACSAKSLISIWHKMVLTYFYKHFNFIARFSASSRRNHFSNVFVVGSSLFSGAPFLNLSSAYPIVLISEVSHIINLISSTKWQLRQRMPATEGGGFIDFAKALHISQRQLQRKMPTKFEVFRLWLSKKLDLNRSFCGFQRSGEALNKETVMASLVQCWVKSWSIFVVIGAV